MKFCIISVIENVLSNNNNVEDHVALMTKKKNLTLMMIIFEMIIILKKEYSYNRYCKYGFYKNTDLRSISPKI